MGEYLVENNQMQRLLKMVSVETAEYGFKAQVPKVSISKNLKIY